MPAKGVIPVQRGNSRGSLGFGGLGNGGPGPFNGNMRAQQKGGFALGPMFIPPPPPPSARPPPKTIVIAPKEEVKLHEAEKPWKPGRRRVGAGRGAETTAGEEKSEDEIMLEVISRTTLIILKNFQAVQKII